MLKRFILSASQSIAKLIHPDEYPFQDHLHVDNLSGLCNNCLTACFMCYSHLPVFTTLMMIRSRGLYTEGCLQAPLFLQAVY